MSYSVTCPRCKAWFQMIEIADRVTCGHCLFNFDPTEPIKEKKPDALDFDDVANLSPPEADLADDPDAPKIGPHHEEDFDLGI